MIEQILKMIPSSAFKSLPEKLETVISQNLAEVEVRDGERPAVLLIESPIGFMVNIVRLDEEADMTIVSQMTLKEFLDNVLKFVKDGKLK